MKRLLVVALVATAFGIGTQVCRAEGEAPPPAAAPPAVVAAPVYVDGCCAPVDCGCRQSCLSRFKDRFHSCNTCCQPACPAPCNTCNTCNTCVDPCCRTTLLDRLRAHKCSSPCDCAAPCDPCGCSSHGKLRGLFHRDCGSSCNTCCP